MRLNPGYADPHDHRYAFVTCKACRRKWQAIDFACSLHRLMCQHVDTDDVRLDMVRQLQSQGFDVRAS